MLSLKRILVILCILTSVPPCISQAKRGDVMIGPVLGYASLDNYTPTSYGGLQIDFMVSDRIGFHYSLLVGKNYLHLPLAPVGGIYVGVWTGTRLGERDSRVGYGLLAGTIAFILTSMIPEGISYNFPVTNGFAIAPYVSPLQFEYLNNLENNNSFAGGAVGLRLNSFIPLEKGYARISPYAEYKVHYSRDTHPGFSTGLNLSMKIKEGKRKKKKTSQT